MNIKPKTIKKCLSCGKDFQTYPYLIKQGNGKYCSRKCSIRENKTKIKKGQRLSIKTEFKKGDIPWNWKGDNAGYQALHNWIKRHKKRKNYCEHCKTKEKELEWANKSGEYKRELEDWLMLCRSCHRLHDNKRRRNDL